MTRRELQSTSDSDLAGLRAPTWTAQELDQATQDFCREHGLPKAAQQPQLFDAFMFNSELDMLEVRLLELYDFVDHFVIREPPAPAALLAACSQCTWTA